MIVKPIDLLVSYKLDMKPYKQRYPKRFDTCKEVKIS